VNSWAAPFSSAAVDHPFDFDSCTSGSGTCELWIPFVAPGYTEQSTQERAMDLVEKAHQKWIARLAEFTVGQLFSALASHS
jgi:hypothetical protein